MTVIDEFISDLFPDNVTKESNNDFVKYYNNSFEILKFNNNRLLVKDKRNDKKTIIYNNIKIAQAKLKDLVKSK